MSAIETAQMGPTPANPADTRPSATEVTGWLLEGRWFTVDLDGRIPAWSPAAAERFGWDRAEVAGQSFTETLLAPEARAAGDATTGSVLSGGAGGQSGYTG